jgi:hypothetical protein
MSSLAWPKDTCNHVTGIALKLRTALRQLPPLTKLRLLPSQLLSTFAQILTTCYSFAPRLGLAQPILCPHILLRLPEAHSCWPPCSGGWHLPFLARLYRARLCLIPRRTLTLYHRTCTIATTRSPPTAQCALSSRHRKPAHKQRPKDTSVCASPPVSTLRDALITLLSLQRSTLAL